MPRRSSGGLRGRLLRSSSEKLKRRDDLLASYVERIVETYPRSVVVLFGSRSRGEELPHSDYDVAVILKSVRDKLSTIEELRKLKPRGLPLDLLVFSVDELSDPMVKKMLRGCRILHNGLGIRID